MNFTNYPLVSLVKSSGTMGDIHHIPAPSVPCNCSLPSLPLVVFQILHHRVALPVLGPVSALFFTVGQRSGIFLFHSQNLHSSSPDCWLRDFVQWAQATISLSSFEAEVKVITNVISHNLHEHCVESDGRISQTWAWEARNTSCSADVVVGTVGFTCRGIYQWNKRLRNQSAANIFTTFVVPRGIPNRKRRLSNQATQFFFFLMTRTWKQCQMLMKSCRRTYYFGSQSWGGGDETSMRRDAIRCLLLITVSHSLDICDSCRRQGSEADFSPQSCAKWTQYWSQVLILAGQSSNIEGDTRWESRARFALRKTHCQSSISSAW